MWDVYLLIFIVVIIIVFLLGIDRGWFGKKYLPEEVIMFFKRRKSDKITITDLQVMIEKAMEESDKMHGLIDRNYKLLTEFLNKYDQLSLDHAALERKTQIIINNITQLSENNNYLKKEIDQIKLGSENFTQVKPQPILYTPQTFFCDKIDSYNPPRFLITKIEHSYKNGIFKIVEKKENIAELYINEDIEAQKRIF